LLPAVVILLTWPWALSPSWILADPQLEAADHIWALWLGSQEGMVIQTDRILGGYDWVLADPLNLLFWAMGSKVTGLGWGFVLAGNLFLAGLGAAALSAETGRGEPWLAALFGASVPALAGGLFTGMSDGMGVGWVALALAGLSWAQRGRWQRGLLAGVLLGLTAWAGPYMAIFTALTAPFFLRKPSAALGVAVLTGGLVALPVVLAVAGRPEGAPGTSAVLQGVLDNPDSWTALRYGADPLSLLWPMNDRYEVVMLGIVPVGLACLGGHRRLAGAALLAAVLSLGFFLQWDDAPVRVGGRLVTLPAAWLGMAVDDLGRISRWTRMAGVAGVLLAPMAAHGAERIGPWLFGVALLEALVHSPLIWPRMSWDMAMPDGYEQLEGPLLHIPPKVRGGKGDRNANLLHQTVHGHVLAENPHQANTRHPAEDWAQALTNAAKNAEPFDTPPPEGVNTLVLLPGDPNEEAWFEAALGPPDLRTDELWAWTVSKM
jgi:hypothetical protein